QTRIRQNVARRPTGQARDLDIKNITSRLRQIELPPHHRRLLQDLGYNLCVASAAGPVLLIDEPNHDLDLVTHRLDRAAQIKPSVGADLCHPPDILQQQRERSQFIAALLQKAAGADFQRVAASLTLSTGLVGNNGRQGQPDQREAANRAYCSRPHQSPSSFSTQRRTRSRLRNSRAARSVTGTASATTVATTTSHLSLKAIASALRGAA